jgi:lipoprotein-anchoring transpeptidase ErfK/SrfK
MNILTRWLLALAAVAAMNGFAWGQVTQVQPAGASSPAATPTPGFLAPLYPEDQHPAAATPAPTAAPESAPVASGSAAPATSGTDAAVTGTEAAAPSPTPVQLHYSVEIDLTHQRVYLLKDGHPFAQSAISSGRPGHPTPVGNFEVIQKDLNHFSNLYGKIVEKDSGRLVKAGADAAMPIPKGCEFQPAPMKWFMRFDGAAGMHAGILPGYAASHGCVRMPPTKAELFFGLVEVGTPVHVFGTPPAHDVDDDHAEHHAAAVVKVVAPAAPPKPHKWWF